LALSTTFFHVEVLIRIRISEKAFLDIKARAQQTIAEKPWLKADLDPHLQHVIISEKGNGLMKIFPLPAWFENVVFGDKRLKKDCSKRWVD
jgi:hypothetical protein